MDIFEIIKNRRSIRQFSQEKLDRNLLIKLVDAARCAPSKANIQPLEYIIVDEPNICGQLFETLSWAGHVRPRRNPAPGQRPTAYIIVLVDTEISANAYIDAAAAIENILLAATGSGIGSCWLGAVDRMKLLQILGIDEKYIIDSVIAIGKSAETPVLEDAGGDDTKYYLDEKNVMHVPKKPLKKILHFNRFGDK